ncbi:MAG: ABC transporter ATP-binding protein [Trueperaceae bacterium]
MDRPASFAQVRSVTKRFGDLVAVDAVDIDVREGEILALLGENGAGKTTLTKILYGMYQPDEGELIIQGRARQLRSPADAIALGVGLVTQHFSLVPSLSVTENVVLGREGGFRLDLRALEASVRATAERFGLEVDPRARVRDLSVGEQQRVEILKALYRDCRLLILDEPTAVLTPQDAERLFSTLDGLRERGLAVVIITHKLAEVIRVSQRVVVLRHGKVAGERPTEGASEQALARAMIGRDSIPVVRSQDHDRIGPVVLEVRDVERVDARGVRTLRGVSFTLHAGEVVGVAAVAGNGQSDLVGVLTGMLRPRSGEVRLAGMPIHDAPPRLLARLGVGRIPEDRMQAVVGELSVAENLAIEHMPDYARRGHLDRMKMTSDALKLIRDYQIKAKPHDKVRTLSGGNVQKLILARTLTRRPRLVVAAQPTRGLDVGATRYVHERLLEQKQRGAAVLLVSEDLDEVLRLSDRILVMYAGEIVGDLPVAQADEGTVGWLMAGKRLEAMHA